MLKLNIRPQPADSCTYPTSRASGSVKTIGMLLWRFLREQRAIAAVEFSLVFPLLLGLMATTIEISHALQASKN